MQRPADIRSYVVKSYSQLTLGEMLTQSELILAFVTACETLVEDNRKAEPTFLDVNAKVKLELKDGGKFGPVDSDLCFTVATLKSFIDELTVMAQLMGMKDKYFHEVILGTNTAFIDLFESDASGASALVAEIYSTLVRRHQNKTRIGSNNDCVIKTTIPGDDYITLVTLKQIDFGEDSIKFTLGSDNAKLNKAIGGNYEYLLPTPLNGMKTISTGIITSLDQHARELMGFTYDQLISKYAAQCDSHELSSNSVLSSALDKGIELIVGLSQQDILAKPLIAVHSHPYRLEFVDLKRKRMETTFTTRLYIQTTLMDITRKVNLTDIINSSPIVDRTVDNEGDLIQFLTSVDDEMVSEMLSAILSNNSVEPIVESQLPLKLRLNDNVDLIVGRSLMSPKLHTVAIKDKSSTNVSTKDFDLAKFFAGATTIPKEMKPVSFWRTMITRLFN